MFRQAKQLLDKKDAGWELTEEELKLVNTAMMPLLGGFIISEDLTISEGLEELATMLEGAIG